MTKYNPNSIIDNWHPFTLADAYLTRPPIEYLAGRMFELPSLNVIYGAPGTLKSFLLADLAVCVASGTPWLPPLGISTGAALPVTQRSVVWFDFDNGKRRTHDRFSALGKALDLPADIPFKYYSMPVPLLDARNNHQIEELAEIITKFKAKLVTIDNLGVISGGADENTVAMIQILSHLRWLVETTGTVLNVIHHRRKSSTTNGRMGDALRGHSSIEAALDLALLVVRENASQNIIVQPTKIRGADIKPFAATFTYQQDRSGGLQKARFFATQRPGLIAAAQRWEVIYRCAGDEQQNKATLSERAHEALEGKYGINLIGSDIDLMVQEGYLLRAKGENNAQLLTRNPKKRPGNSAPAMNL